MKNLRLNNRQYYSVIALITIAGFITRYVNINYASLWADELYSAILANKSNSWYEVLYLQRAYQPPAYAFCLWVWVKIFAYNEFYIRLFTVLAGTACIAISAALGKKIHSSKAGIILAVIVAFSPVQIWYSLEARFYVFIYLFAAISLWLYWHIITNKKTSPWVYLVKGINDAVLCYFHHFGVILIFAQFIFDIWLFVKTKDRNAFLKKTGGYIVSAVLYLPWIVWGLSEAVKVEQYWLKEIDIPAYLEFSFQYPLLINCLAFLFIAIFFFEFLKKQTSYIIFPLTCIIVTLVPVLYSYIKMPMLVARYSMVMAPALYVMVALGIVFLTGKINIAYTTIKVVAVVLILAVFSVTGLRMSFFNKEKLDKQPWREMGNWLNQQEDADSTKVYSIGSYVKNKKNIDFYTKSPQHSFHVDDIVPGKEKKMYIVTTDGIWGMQDSLLKRLDSFYIIRQQVFKPASIEGRIYICSLKQ